MKIAAVVLAALTSVGATIGSASAPPRRADSNAGRTHVERAPTDAKSDWATAFKLRRATLKLDLPSIAGGAGILTLAPDRGVYYRFGYLSDSDPDPLLIRLRAETSSGKVVKHLGLVAQGGAPTKLVFLRSTSAVTISKVDAGETDITIWLWDEFGKGAVIRSADPPSTCFSIVWPRKISKDFQERSEIEALIDKVLQFRR